MTHIRPLYNLAVSTHMVPIHYKASKWKLLLGSAEEAHQEVFYWTQNILLLQTCLLTGTAMFVRKKESENIVIPLF